MTVKGRASGYTQGLNGLVPKTATMPWSGRSAAVGTPFPDIRANTRQDAIESKVKGNIRFFSEGTRTYNL